MSRFLNNVVSSLRSLYFAIVSFVVIYAAVAMNVHDHREATSRLIALDKLLALRYVKSVIHTDLAPATQGDLRNFFSRASMEFQEKWSEKLDADFEEAAKEAMSEDNQNADRKPSTSRAERVEKEFFSFINRPITGAAVLKNVQARLAVGGSCELLVTRLLPGDKFNFATFQAVGAVYTVASENTRLVSFGSSCEPGQAVEFNALLFSLPEGEFAFAIVESIEFPGLLPPLPFKPFTFLEIEGVKRVLPPDIAKYVNLTPKLMTLHERAIDIYILRYASARSGKFFRADQLDEAVQELYEEKEKSAAYLGISTTSTLLLRIGPLIYFALSFELWRRTRLLPVRKIRSDEYWFGFETQDWIGRTYAYLCAVAPILFSAFVYVAFAVSQDLGQPIFGYMVSIKGLINWNFPPVPPPGWIVSDTFAGVIGTIVVPFQFLISFLTVKKLVRVIKANSAKIA